MITITYKCDSEFPGTDTECKVSITDATTCTNAFEAFVRVLQLAGYSQQAIRYSAESVEYDMREHIEAAASFMSKRVGDS